MCLEYLGREWRGTKRWLALRAGGNGGEGEREREKKKKHSNEPKPVRSAA